MAELNLNQISNGETENIEYKADIPPKSESYMKTVVAYANANGGRIVFGVEDNTWNIIGFERDEVFRKMDAVTNAIYDSCEPKITPCVSIQEFDGKYIIIVDVPAGTQKPYCIKSQGMVDGVYIRVSGTTRKAAIYQVQEMVLNARNRCYDQEKTDRELSDDEIDAFCERLYAHGLELCDDDAERKKLKKIGKGQLLSYKLVTEDDGHYYATNGYQLLDGHLEDYPDAVVQCAVFKGKNRNIFITRKEFKGSIDVQVESAYAFVLEHIDMGARFEGLGRRDIYELPIRAIREIITNAVCHRSYLSPGKVQVALFDDRLEVTSPGMLDSDLTIKKMRNGLSRVRNRGIAEAFAYMHMIEGWGSGIPDMISAAASYGLPEPELIDMGSDFRVNLYRRALKTDQHGVVEPESDETKSETIEPEIGPNGPENETNGPKSETNETKNETNGPKSETNGPENEPNEPKTGPDGPKNGSKLGPDEPKVMGSDEECLMALILEDGTITQNVMQEKLGISRSSLKRLLLKLKSDGKIERIGSNRSGRWQVRG